MAVPLLHTVSNPLPLNPAANPVALTEPLLQYVSHGHALGFSQDSVLVAALDRALHIEFVDANGVAPTVGHAFGSGSQNQVEDASQFTSVSYADLWDGITAVYEAQQGAILKSTFYVDAGLAESAVDQIRLQYNRQVTPDASGNLVIAYDNGFMTDSAPIAWQDIDGQRIYIDVQYVLLGNNQVGFEVGEYDLSHQLVIDPTLTWSTFLGGTGNDLALAVAVDNSGNVYVTGSSTATWGTPIRAYTLNTDAFVAKLNSSGSILWSTFLGANGADVGRGIAGDSSGSIYVVGDSSQTWGSPLRAYSSGTDSFVAKLDTNGSILWNTFLGGTGTDWGRGIALDSGGNISVIGDSTVTWGAPLRNYPGSADSYVARLNNNGALIWNTFLGGTGSDIGRAIAVDNSGNVFVAGNSAATWGTPLRAYTASTDGFTARLNNSGGLVWNTFLGGAGADIILSLALDASGSVFLAGTSTATWGSPLSNFVNGTDGIVVKLDINGGILWNTFLGGTGTDNFRAIAVESTGNIFVGGDSSSSWGPPVTPKSSGWDAQLIKLNSNGTRIWNTFAGGTGADSGFGLAVDSIGSAYLVGTSTASWGSPVRSYTSTTDGFVTRFAVNDAPVLANTALSIAALEDTTAPAGAIGSLISSIAAGISDPDSNAAKGIAITASNETIEFGISPWTTVRPGLQLERLVQVLHYS